MCQSPPHAPGATGAQDPQLLKNTPPHLSHILFASLNLSVRPHARTPGILPTGPFFFFKFVFRRQLSIRLTNFKNESDPTGCGANRPYVIGR